MKNSSFLFFLFFVMFYVAQGQDDTVQNKPFQFTVIKEITTTPVENQSSSGTCWSFATLAFVESEMIRMGKDTIDLSEMFVVRMVYIQKAEKYVRMHGRFNFGGGGAVNDVIDVIRDYGMVPEEVYKGLNYGTELHKHGELDAVLKAYLDAVIENKNRTLSTAWKAGFEGILDAYLGRVPEKFQYKGKEYNPMTFAKNIVGINPDDYVCLTSFTHHPFYQPFIVELEDNWSWHSFFNIPIDDLIAVMNYSISNNYTVGWGGDVSEKGFSFKNGVAIVPEEDVNEMAETDRQRWEKKSADEKKKLLYSFETPVPEKRITQEMRQQAFDNYATTDDHGLLFCGLATDQKGTKYFKIKNSWGTENSKFDGYFYASEAYVKYKTTTIIVNRNAIPKEILKELKIK